MTKTKVQIDIKIYGTAPNPLIDHSLKLSVFKLQDPLSVLVSKSCILFSADHIKKTGKTLLRKIPTGSNYTFDITEQAKRKTPTIKNTY